MSLELTVTANTVPASVTYPATPKDLIETLLVQYLRVSLAAAGSLALINFGETTPGASESDKPWLRLDGSGRPLGWYVYYNGSWVKAWNDPVGTIRPFVGVAATVIPEGWYLANGANGTDDLTTNMTENPSGSGTYKIGYMQYMGYS